MKYIIGLVFFITFFWWSSSEVLAQCCNYGTCYGYCGGSTCYGSCVEPTSAPQPTPYGQSPTAVPTLSAGFGAICGNDRCDGGESQCLQDGSNAGSCCLRDCGYAVDPATQEECGTGACGDGTFYTNFCSPSCNAPNRTCFTNRTCNWGGAGCTSDASCVAGTVGAQCGNGAPAGCGVIRCNLPSANGQGGNCWSDCSACAAPQTCGSTTCSGGGSCGAAITCRNNCGSWTEYDTSGCPPPGISAPNVLTSTEDCINDQIIFTWNKVTGATYYEMEILNWYNGRASYTCGDDAEDKCLSDVGNLGSYTFTPTVGLYYRWRVRGRDRNAHIGTWSAYTDKQVSGVPICTGITGFSTFPWSTGNLKYTNSASPDYVNAPKSVSTAFWSTACDGSGPGVNPAPNGAEETDCRADLRWYSNTNVGASLWESNAVIQNHPPGFATANAHGWAFGCYSNDFCGSMLSNYVPKTCSVTATRSPALVGGSDAYDITASGNANIDPGSDNMRLFVAKKDGTRTASMPYFVPGVGQTVSLTEKNSCAGTGSWAECYGGATTANGYWIYQVGNDTSYISTNAVSTNMSINNVVLSPGEYAFWCDFSAATADEQDSGVYKTGSMVTGDPWCTSINTEIGASAYFPTVVGAKLACTSPIAWRDAGTNDYALFSVNSVPTVDQPPLEIKNGVLTLTANAGRNHSCEGSIIGADPSNRSLTFKWSASDSDGASDIVRSSIRFTDGASVFYQIDATKSGASWNYSGSGSQAASVDILSNSVSIAGNTVTQNVEVGISGASFTEGIYAIELQVEDSSGQISSWTGTSRSLRVWDCLIDVSGLVYDTGSDAPSCLGASSYAARGYSQYGKVDFRKAWYDVIGLGSTINMQVTSTSAYISSGLKMIWGQSYLPNLRINAVPGNQIRVTQAGGTSQCLANVNVNANLDPYLDDQITVEHGVRSNSEGWWQVINGNVNAGGQIYDNIADLCGDSVSGNQNCTPAIIKPAYDEVNNISPGTFSNLSDQELIEVNTKLNGTILGKGLNTTRSDRQSGEWLIENTGHKVRDSKNFEYYRNTMFTQRGIGVTINAGVGGTKLFSEIVGANHDNTGIYLVDGVLNVDVGNTVASGSYLLVVASQGISVGTSVANMEGIFIAASKQASGVKANIEFLDSPRDTDNFPISSVSEQLVIKGLVYADGDLRVYRTINALSAPGAEPSVDGRALNNGIPAVKIIYDASSVFSLPGSLNSLRTNWRSR